LRIANISKTGRKKEYGIRENEKWKREKGEEDRQADAGIIRPSGWRMVAGNPGMPNHLGTRALIFW